MNKVFVRVLEQRYKECYGYNIQEDIKMSNRVHCWQNYIEDELANEWDNLSIMEKKILFVDAVEKADREEWE